MSEKPYYTENTNYFKHDVHVQNSQSTQVEAYTGCNLSSSWSGAILLCPDFRIQQPAPQGQYWAGRAPPPNNGNYQYGRR